MAIYAKGIDDRGDIQSEVLLESSITSKLTEDGGIAVLMINDTGATSEKGTVLRTSTKANAVRKLVVDIPDPIGVFLDSGVGPGSLAWVVISGAAFVDFATATTAGYFARGFLTADGGTYATGKALCEQLPTSPFASDKHFFEIGHVIQTITAPGLAKCILHFN